MFKKYEDLNNRLKYAIHTMVTEKDPVLRGRACRMVAVLGLEIAATEEDMASNGLIVITGGEC